MKKKLFTVIGCAALACALLVGCKSGDNNNDDVINEVSNTKAPSSSKAPSNTEAVIGEVEYSTIFSTTYANIGDETFSVDNWWVDSKNNTFCVFDSTQSKAIILKLSSSKSNAPIVVDLSGEAFDDIIFHNGYISTFNLSESTIKYFDTEGNVVSTNKLDLTTDSNPSNQSDRLTPSEYDSIKFEIFGNTLYLKFSYGNNAPVYYSSDRSSRDSGFIRVNPPYTSAFISNNGSENLVVNYNGNMHTFENSSQFSILGVNSSGIYILDVTSSQIRRYNLSGELLAYCSISNEHTPINKKTPFLMFGETVYTVCSIDGGFELDSIPLIGK